MIHNNYFSVADDDRKWFYDSLKIQESVVIIVRQLIVNKLQKK